MAVRIIKEDLDDFRDNLIDSNVPENVVDVLVRWKDMAVDKEFKRNLKYILNSEYYEDGHLVIKFNWGLFRITKEIAKKKLKEMLNEIGYNSFSVGLNEVIIEPFDEE